MHAGYRPSWSAPGRGSEPEQTGSDGSTRIAQNEQSWFRGRPPWMPACSAFSSTTPTVCIRENAARIDLRRQHRSGGEQVIGLGGGVAAVERAGDQFHIETNRRPFLQERHGVVVRGDAAGDPAVAKAAGIEERPQIGLAVLRSE